MPKTNDPEQWPAKKEEKENNRQIMTIFWHLNMTNNKLERRVDPFGSLAASATEVRHLSCDEIRVIRFFRGSTLYVCTYMGM